MRARRRSLLLVVGLLQLRLWRVHDQRGHGEPAGPGVVLSPRDLEGLRRSRHAGSVAIIQLPDEGRPSMGTLDDLLQVLGNTRTTRELERAAVTRPTLTVEVLEDCPA
jgi:hypothetical protein